MEEWGCGPEPKKKYCSPKCKKERYAQQKSAGKGPHWTWTEEQVSLLKNRDLTIQELHDLMPEHTIQAIRTRISKLKLYRSKQARSKASVFRKTIEDMQELARKKDGKCLSTEYVNSKAKLEFECSNKHRWWALPYNIKNHWCPKCAAIKSRFRI